MDKAFFEKYPSYQAYSKNFLGAWSFEDGDEVVTISDIKEVDMYDKENAVTKKEVCLFFKEKELPMVLSAKKNYEAIAYVLGTNKWANWINRQIILGARMDRGFAGKNQLCLRVIPEKPKSISKEPATPEQLAKIRELIENGTITNETAMLKYFRIKSVEELSKGEAADLIRKRTGEAAE